jgi:hypothetical protein
MPFELLSEKGQAKLSSPWDGHAQAPADERGEERTVRGASPSPTSPAASPQASPPPPPVTKPGSPSEGVEFASDEEGGGSEDEDEGSGGAVGAKATSVTRPEPRRGNKGGSFMSRMSASARHSTSPRRVSGRPPPRASKFQSRQQTTTDAHVLSKQQLEEIIRNPKVRSAAEAGKLAEMTLRGQSGSGRHASVYTKSGASVAAVARAAGAAACAYVQANGGADEDAAVASAMAAAAAMRGNSGTGGFQSIQGIAEDADCPPPPSDDYDSDLPPPPSTGGRLEAINSNHAMSFSGVTNHTALHNEGGDVLFGSLQAAPEGTGKRMGGGKRLSTTPLRVSLTRSSVTTGALLGGHMEKQHSKMHLSGGRAGASSAKKGFLMKVRGCTPIPSVPAPTLALPICSCPSTWFLYTCHHRSDDALVLRTLVGWRQEHVWPAVLAQAVLRVREWDSEILQISARSHLRQTTGE